MSTRRTEYETNLDMYVGTTKIFTLVVKDPVTALPKDLTNTAVYNSGNVKIYKPDGTIIVTVTVTYSDRANGEIEFTIVAATAVLANAGNWIGNMELINDAAVIVEQQNFGFNILENY